MSRKGARVILASFLLFSGAGEMPDPILDEIQRVRELLIKRHGGWKGYFAYIQKLDRGRQSRKKRLKSGKATKRSRNRG
jgi:hypothetical protein